MTPDQRAEIALYLHALYFHCMLKPGEKPYLQRVLRVILRPTDGGS